jgi:23S rRNA pseudouridine1911/1915/1917 synthase
MDPARTPFEPIPEPRIVFEEEGVIVVAKPSGMHCAPASEPGTLCAWLFERRPGVAVIRGRGPDEGGLLHRLDAATSGLVAFASDGEAFASLMRSAAEGRFIKSYRAVGRPSVSGLAGSSPLLLPPPGFGEAEWRSRLMRSDAEAIAAAISGMDVESRFRPYGPGAARVACARPAADPEERSRGGKAWTREPYTTAIVSSAALGGLVVAEAALARGFRHQVRAHFAWLGLPLEGDPLYGDGDDSAASGQGASSASGWPGLGLRAFQLSFPSPREPSPPIEAESPLRARAPCASSPIIVRLDD